MRKLVRTAFAAMVVVVGGTQGAEEGRYCTMKTRAGGTARTLLGGMVEAASTELVK